MKKTIDELKQKLGAEQAAAMERIFNANGKANEVSFTISDAQAEKLMNPHQKNVVRAQKQYEVIQQEVRTAKSEFLAAGVEFAEAVHERIVFLEETLFGGVREHPVAVRMSLGEKTEEQLDQLLTQAIDSNDDELAALVLFGAHVNDFPAIRARYFEEVDHDREIADLYDELVNAPGEDELAQYIEEDYFERASEPAQRLLPTVEDLALRSPTKPILLR